MLRSSASLMAEDVTIRCRIRLSPSATDPQFGTYREMTCTMRNWESRSMSASRGGRVANAANSMSSTSSNHHAGFSNVCNGPELLLTPIHEILSSRDDSPVRRINRSSTGVGNSQNKDENMLPMSIPIHEIMMIDKNKLPQKDQSEEQAQRVPLISPHQRSLSAKLTLYITTLSMGFYEFQCLNRNGHDILMAFLRASVDHDRILETAGGVSFPSNQDLMSTSSVASSCFDLDVDGLHAQHFSNQKDRESWPEKMSRRVGKAISSLSELCTTNLCDYACCSSHQPHHSHEETREGVPVSAAATPASAIPSSTIESPSRKYQNQQLNKRPNFGFRYSDLELDDTDSQAEQPVINKDKTTRKARFPDLGTEEKTKLTS